MAGAAAAASDSGVTSRLTTGIAMALASGDTTDTCRNSNSVSGTSPAVTAHCVRAAAASVARMRCQRVSGAPCPDRAA
ncbi:hypothetical protein D3C81_1407190 [compost metagenome]